MRFPYPSFELLNRHFRDVEIALKDTNYEEVIALATRAIDDLVRTMNFAHCAILDKRFQARIMRKEYMSALKDANRMIEILPSSADGYLRAGEVYMQLLCPKKAVAVYDRGIEEVPLFDPQRAQLLGNKSTAELRDKHIDFVHVLPSNVLLNIFQQLSISTRATCAQQSKEWRKQILDNPELWETVACLDDRTAATITNLAYRIGPNIKHLTLSGKLMSSKAMGEVLALMEHGHFDRLQWLSITALPSELFQYQPMIRALKRLTSLRRLAIALVDSPPHGMQIVTYADILKIFPELTDLKYHPNCPLQACVGDLGNLDLHRSLINMELRHTTIDHITLEPLLRICPSIRRLSLMGCEKSVIPVVEACCPELEILGYKSSIPELTDTERTSNSNGLRIVQFPLNGRFEDFTEIISLLYKHMETLEDLELKFSDLTNLDTVEHLKQMYPAFKLPKLKRMTTWLHSNTKTIILPAIVGSTTLMDLCIKSVDDKHDVVEALLTIPHLKCLRIDDQGTGKSSSPLRRLFQEYRSPNYALEYLELRRSSSVNDTILNSITDIPNLKGIVLAGCKNISTSGFAHFMDKLQNRNQTLVSMELAGLDSMRDWIIQKLVHIPNLQSVELKSLRCITSQGIIDLASKISTDTCSLKQITITKCFNGREPPTVLQALKIPGCCLTVT